MKPYFKSFLLLAFVNLFLCLPVLLFLEAQFLIPAVALLVVFNAYLYLFHPLKILKHFSLQHFGLNDPWDITKSLKEFQNFQNITFYKTKIDLPIALCFGNQKKYYIILSERLLDVFSKKEIKLLLSYYSQSISNGSILFLTLLSGIIYFADVCLFILNYPFKYFQKKKSINFIMVWKLYFLSWVTSPFFLKLDRQFVKTKEEKNLWALFVWKIDSLYKLEKRNFPTFFAPLFVANPLTNSKWECYLSLHPRIKSRVKHLIGSYPP